jgi:hypothetical protein
MSALSGFLGGAIVGAGTAYTKLADEQRAFRIEQTKQDALYARMLNLKRAEKDMEYSGVLDEYGMPMTRKQLDEYDGDRSALSSSVDQAAELQKIKEAGQPSQYMTQDRVVLTKGELEEYVKNNGSLEGLTPVGLQERRDKVSDQAAAEARADRRQQRSDSRYLARQAAQAAAAEARQAAALEKEERARTDYYSKGLQNTVLGSEENVQTKFDNSDLEVHPGMSEEDSLNAWKTTARIDATIGYLRQVPPSYKENLIKENPLLRELTTVPSVVRSGKLSGKSIEEVRETLASEGYKPKQIDLVIDYAISKGYAKYSSTASRYYNGIEWISTPGYRMKKR